ncbi:FitA-like ribbon-helix-helix domain-containing protein [Rhodanobacter ginsengiterrae]|uniref:FitA-like ribbon-helix-helix domain-containing protein n=1 Tax=Rhodanobacter ginsengiterrae TaxID=2008451 RepID=UPI003CF2FCC2
MTTITIRHLDADLEARLRLRAAQHGQSMEDEARSILCNALQAEPSSGQSLLDSIRARGGAVRRHRAGAS